VLCAELMTQTSVPEQLNQQHGLLELPRAGECVIPRWLYRCDDPAEHALRMVRLTWLPLLPKKAAGRACF
jgi:hypothetical protein